MHWLAVDGPQATRDPRRHGQKRPNPVERPALGERPLIVVSRHSEFCGRPATHEAYRPAFPMRTRASVRRSAGRFHQPKHLQMREFSGAESANRGKQPLVRRGKGDKNPEPERPDAKLLHGTTVSRNGPPALASIVDGIFCLGGHWPPRRSDRDVGSGKVVIGRERTHNYGAYCE